MTNTANGINKSTSVENRETLWCDPHQQRRFYRSCLCLRDAYDAGRIRAEDANQDCSQAMKRGNCNAYKMRDEEIAAGKSLYFTDASPRTLSVANKEVDRGSEGYQRGWAQVGASLGKGDVIPKNVVKHIPIKSVPVKDDSLFGSSTIDMASIISNEVKSENRFAKQERLISMKKEIALLAKTDLSAARVMLAEAKKLELSMAA